jgi:hypothetical protein
MKNYIAISIIGLALSGCQPEVIEDGTFIEKPAQAGNFARPAPKPAAVVGVWSGSSHGESITVKFGSNGSVILNNDAGAHSGSWSSQGSGRYGVNVAGQSGSMVLLNSLTASLNIGGSTIELRR